MSVKFVVSIYFIVFVSDIIQYGNGYRILAVFPTPSISHQVVFRGLALALNERGHELVVVTPNPINKPGLENYTEIDISFSYNYIRMPETIEDLPNTNWFQFIYFVESLIHDKTHAVLDYREVRKIYEPNSNEKFDLILMETLYSPAFLPLATRFNVPIVGIVSLGLPIELQYGMGSPILTSHPSIWELGRQVSGSLTFWQRIINFYNIWSYLYYYKTVFMQKQEIIARKYFGNDIPNLLDIERNVSLVFVNQETLISHVKPYPPNVIEIGGFHISKDIKPLDKDLQRILDEATQGFVYMSLGSNILSNALSDETQREIIAAFSNLSYQVIWKFEGYLPEKPDNVLSLKWAPQQAILAHPNLKVFIYQGGLQSTEEAIHHAVPLIGLPVIADQEMLVNKMVSLDVAKKLEINRVNKVDLLDAICSIALDNGYKQRMLKLRSLLNDKPYNPLENAVWWTEYVIRHKGASHLHSSTADEPWYSRQDMDIIATFSAGFVIFIFSISVILYRCLVYGTNSFIHRNVGKKQKQN